jgi:hypothetical protein
VRETRFVPMQGADAAITCSSFASIGRDHVRERAISSGSAGGHLGAGARVAPVGRLIFFLQTREADTDVRRAIHHPHATGAHGALAWRRCGRPRRSTRS